MSIQGRVENGTIVLDETVSLPEGAFVEIEVVEEPNVTPDSPAGTTLYERLSDVVGLAGDGLPADMATQHDHYAHGTPKR